MPGSPAGGQGLEFELKIELCRLIVVKVLSALIEKNFRSVENAEVENSCESIPALIHQTVLF